jgi:hypothetical protein
MPQITTITATIRAGESVSDAIDSMSETMTAIIFPPDWTSSGGITLQLSVDNVTYFDVYQSNGKDLTMAVKPGGAAVIDPNVGRAARYFKLRSGTVAKPVNQAADRVFQIMLAP